jgi:hypothetical protein
MDLDSGAGLNSRFEASRLVPVGLGAERGGEEIDERTRLRRQMPSVRIDGINCHVAVEAIAR